MVCNMNHVIAYASWLINDSKIPTFMLWMLIISTVAMLIILISEIRIKIEEKVLDKVGGKAP